MNTVTIPQYLKEGDTIGIVCPSGYMDVKRAEVCIQTLQQWGFKVKIGKTLGLQDHYFAGTDEERKEDLQKMLDDDQIGAILCGRGGYGMNRIVDQLDFTHFVQTPKWIIGYSDITLLHTHINKQLNIASLHSPMAGAFNDGQEDSVYIQALKNTLLGNKQSFEIDNKDSFRIAGCAEGTLIGGNLTLLATALGTASDADFDDKIVFIEDVGEYIYGVDRMFIQLLRAQKFDKAKAILFGSFTEMKDTTIPFGKTIQEALYAHVKNLNIPVGFDFPIGHSDANFPLKEGVNYQLTVSEEKIILAES